MSPREVANLYNVPEHIQRIKSVIYPMQVAKSGAFLSQEEAHRSNIHFLLDFLRGAAFWRPDYGVDLDQLEQAGSELDTMLPVVSFQLRQNIEDFVPRVVIDGLIVTRELQERRALRFDLLYRTLYTNRIARATIDDTLIQRAVQPNIIVREKSVTSEVTIPWESVPTPAVDPYLSLARSSQDQSGWICWGATETMTGSPSATNSAFTLPIVTGAIDVGGGGTGYQAAWRKYPGTVPFSNRHAGSWGLYYRAIGMVDSLNSNYFQAALWGLSEIFFPDNGNFAYFRVVDVSGVPNARVPGTLQCVVQDGKSSGQQTQVVDLGINMVDEAHLLEIVIIPGAVKFFVDGVEKLHNTFTIPPDSNIAPNSEYTASQHCRGDNPPGTGSGSSFPTGFFTPNDGLRYERLQGGGSCAMKTLEQRFSLFDYPDEPPV